jgi:cysteine-rich repeat protein
MQCRIEKGFFCTGTKPTKCTEICGDGLNLGYYQCDDMNLVNGDGCSSTCTIEPGWKCSGGCKTSRDKCVEICGDGLNLGNYQCDDGNNVNGDG